MYAIALTTLQEALGTLAITGLLCAYAIHLFALFGQEF